jgi:hypothetical protein
MSATIELKCAGCDRDLDGRLVVGKDGKAYLEVDPCQGCMDDAEHDAVLRERHGNFVEK